MNRLKLPCGHLFLLVVAVSPGCNCEVRDRYQTTSESGAKLRELGMIIDTAHQAGLDPASCRSLSEMLKRVRTKEIVSQYILDDPDILQDGWGNQYSWAVENRPRKTLITITSPGRDEEFGSSARDDISVIVTLHEDGSSDISMVWPYYYSSLKF